MQTRCVIICRIRIMNKRNRVGIGVIFIFAPHCVFHYWLCLSLTKTHVFHRRPLHHHLGQKPCFTRSILFLFRQQSNIEELPIVSGICCLSLLCWNRMPTAAGGWVHQYLSSQQGVCVFTAIPEIGGVNSNKHPLREGSNGRKNKSL